jgi:excisionase family DNA binding protein
MDSAYKQYPIGKAAKTLGISPSTIRRWEKEGKLATSRTLGGQRRFGLEEIQELKSKKSDYNYQQKPRFFNFFRTTLVLSLAVLSLSLSLCLMFPEPEPWLKNLFLK